MRCPHCNLEVKAIVRFNHDRVCAVVCTSCSNILIVEDYALRKLTVNELEEVLSDPRIEAIVEALNERKVA